MRYYCNGNENKQSNKVRVASTTAFKGACFLSIASIVFFFCQIRITCADSGSNSANQTTTRPRQPVKGKWLTAVESVAISSNGHYTVTRDSSGMTRLWDLAAGVVKRTFPENHEGLRSVLISPDGHFIVTSRSDHRTQLWDAMTGKKLPMFDKPLGWTFSGSFSLDGHYMITGGRGHTFAGDDTTVRLWDTSTGMEVQQFEGNADNFYNPTAVSPDGRYVLTSGKDFQVWLWDVATARKLRSFKGHSAAIHSLNFSPDGRFALTASHDMTARLWDVSTGLEVQRFEGHSSGITSARFAADGRYVLTASYDKTARLWDAATGDQITVFQGHSSSVYSSTMSPDERWVVTGSGDGSVGIWDARSGKELARLMTYNGTAWAVAEPSGRFDASNGGDVGFLYWVMGFKAISADKLKKDYYEPTLLAKILGFNKKPLRPVQPMTRAMMHPPVKYKSNHEKNRKRSNQPERPELIAQLGHGSLITSVAFSPDGKLVLTGGDKAILWDRKTGRELRRFSRQYSDLSSIAFSPDGRTIVGGWEDGTVILWNASTGMELRRFQSSSRKVTSIAFSPDGRTIVGGGGDGTAQLWDTSTGAVLRRFQGIGRRDTSVAIAPNGRYLLTGGDFGTAVLWDIDSKRPIRQFTGHGRLWKSYIIPSRITAVAFSPDGQIVLTGSGDGTARLWDASTATELHRLVGHSLDVNSVAFSPNGRYVLTGSYDETVKLWDATSGKLLRTFTVTEDVVTSMSGAKIARQGAALILNPETREIVPVRRGVRSVAFSPDSSLVLAGITDSTARLWDLEGGEVHRFEGYISGAQSVRFSPNDRYIIMSLQESARLWDTLTGSEVFRSKYPPAWGDHSLAWSSDSRLVLVGCTDGTARLRDALTGAEVHRFEHSPEEEHIWVAISPDDHYVLTASNKIALLWDMKSGEKLRRFVDEDRGTTDSAIYSIAFSPDSRFILTGHENGRAVLWDASTGTALRLLEDRKQGTSDVVLLSVAFWPDGRYVLTGCEDGIVRLWDLASGEEVRRFEGHQGPVFSVTCSPDGRYVLTGGYDGTARLWDATGGKNLRVYKGHSGKVNSVAFSSNGRYVVTSGSDGTILLWRMETVEEDADVTITPSFTGEWLVIDRDGRFDTGDVENAWNLHWVMPDDPYTPLPMEIFTRDYFEPQLLQRLLAGEKFKKVRALSELNRVQPKVEIATIEPEPCSPEPCVPRRVTVTVEISGDERPFGKCDKQKIWRTGVYDLRLFRNRQLVGYEPRRRDAVTGLSPTEQMNEAVKLKQWRETYGIQIDEKTDKQRVTFRHIPLPRKKGIDSVEFSAYAFNEDRVKSATARKKCSLIEAKAKASDIGKECLLQKPPPRIGRAYVIAVGVNAYETDDWNLQYAAKDAEKFLEVFPPLLKDTKEYTSVVGIPLISDWIQDQAGGEKKVTLKDATKVKIKAVLDLLAGRDVDEELRARIPHADQLRTARPEDLVLIIFSSHGYADQSGIFYLFPYDIGSRAGKRVTSELLKRTISSDELSAWMRDIDAGELVMIIDACHSAASVEGTDFKPGPMGSSGLGQLAYDKGMRILTSTRADDVAWESRMIKQGLLVYALVQEGLLSKNADFDPEDKSILLSEWLKYGEKEVPELYTKVKRGQMNGDKENGGRLAAYRKGGEEVYEPLVDRQLRGQTPKLFDFRRSFGYETTIWRSGY